MTLTPIIVVDRRSDSLIPDGLERKRTKRGMDSNKRENGMKRTEWMDWKQTLTKGTKRLDCGRKSWRRSKDAISRWNEHKSLNLLYRWMGQKAGNEREEECVGARVNRSSLYKARGSPPRTESALIYRV